MHEEPTHALASHVCDVNFHDLPSSTVAATKRDVGDCVAAILGGNRAAGVDAIVELLVVWQGRGEATCLGRGDRLPAPQAALVNGTMGHALDFDDSLDAAGSIHPGVCTLSAALATAELLGNVTGAQLLCAVAIGLDIACRLSTAATGERGWHRTSAIGIFGAAAASAKLRRLPVDQVMHAFGIAYAQSSGNRQSIVDAALTKRFQAGHAASGGVLSADLASRGLTGAREVFAGRHGFFPLYQPDGYDLTPVTLDLGTRFMGERLSFKPYPCDRGTHVAIDAARQLFDELNGIAAETSSEITRIIVDCPQDTHFEYFGPHACAEPSHSVEAQFCLPYLVAVALAHGNVEIEHIVNLSERAIGLLPLFAGQITTDLPSAGVRLTVETTTGRVHSQTVSIPLGSPENPLGEDASIAKLRSCAQHGVPALSEDAVGRLITLMENVESLSTVQELVSATLPS